MTSEVGGLKNPALKQAATKRAPRVAKRIMPMQPAFSRAQEKRHTAPRLTIDSGVLVPRRAEMQVRPDHNLVSIVWRNSRTWSCAYAVPTD